MSPNRFNLTGTTSLQKRERSASPSSPQPITTAATAPKRSRIDSLFLTPTSGDQVSDLGIAINDNGSDDVFQSFWANQSPVLEDREIPATPTRDTGLWVPLQDVMETDDEEEENGVTERYSLGDRPFRRSLYSELLLSSNLGPDDEEILQRSRRKSATIISSLFEDEVEAGDEEDEDEEDEKTTMPLSRPYIPKSTPYDDEVDAFFSSYNPPADEPEYVLSSSLKMSILQQQHKLPPKYITEWPHFLTTEYFELHGPNDRLIISPEEEKLIQITTTPYFDSKFSILKNMGSGEYAEVWKVLELRSNATNAVKKSKLAFTGWDDRWQQLIEVDHLRRVQDSKYCVNMLNAWEERGYLYIQLELCSSGSLDKYLDFKKRKIPQDIVWNIFREIVLGVRDIHQVDIVHLDLKPSNILIDDEGYIKIGDFGISVHTPVDVRWVKGEGDRRYMAPDLLREEFDKPADIFSLGLILLELATGIVLPGTGESWEMLRTGDFSKQNTALSKLSLELREMIEWLLTTARKKRPSVQDILKHPHFAVVDSSQEASGCLLSYVYEMQAIAAEQEDRLEHRNTFSTPEGRII